MYLKCIVAQYRIGAIAEVLVHTVVSATFMKYTYRYITNERNHRLCYYDINLKSLRNTAATAMMTQQHQQQVKPTTVLNQNWYTCVHTSSHIKCTYTLLCIDRFVSDAVCVMRFCTWYCSKCSLFLSETARASKQCSTSIQLTSHCRKIRAAAFVVLLPLALFLHQYAMLVHVLRLSGDVVLTWFPTAFTLLYTHIHTHTPRSACLLLTAACFISPTSTRPSLTPPHPTPVPRSGCSL
jgi:hypothetical protein